MGANRNRGRRRSNDVTYDVTWHGASWREGLQPVVAPTIDHVAERASDLRQRGDAAETLLRAGWMTSAELRQALRCSRSHAGYLIQRMGDKLEMRYRQSGTRLRGAREYRMRQ